MSVSVSIAVQCLSKTMTDEADSEGLNASVLVAYRNPGYGIDLNLSTLSRLAARQKRCAGVKISFLKMLINGCCLTTT
jgi:hypothetical protein